MNGNIMYFKSEKNGKMEHLFLTDNPELARKVTAELEDLGHTVHVLTEDGFDVEMIAAKLEGRTARIVAGSI